MKPRHVSARLSGSIEVSTELGTFLGDARVRLLEAIAQSLRAGRNIELRGFGRFKVRARQARTARNPRTGEVVEVPGGLKPVFEASRELRELLNAPDHDLATLQNAIGKAFPAEVLVESDSESE